jgi:hypothetical protein
MAVRLGVMNFHLARLAVMTPIYIPSQSPEDWRRFLAEPDKQWKAGYSAQALAYAWEEAKGFPDSVRSVFEKSELLRSAEPLIGIPEHQVPLPGGSRPSQNDLWVLGRLESGLISIAVEGKVSEPFGPTVEKWLVEASAGKRVRLAYLLSILGLEQDVLGSLRYQLLHRTASAIIEARRFRARYAMMMVHSFNQENKWFEDYREFVERFGAQPRVNDVVSVGQVSDVGLFFAWVKGDSKYLSSR